MYSIIIYLYYELQSIFMVIFSYLKFLVYVSKVESQVNKFEDVSKFKVISAARAKLNSLEDK